MSTPAKHDLTRTNGPSTPNGHRLSRLDLAHQTAVQAGASDVAQREKLNIVHSLTDIVIIHQRTTAQLGRGGHCDTLTNLLQRQSVIINLECINLGIRYAHELSLGALITSCDVRMTDEPCRAVKHTRRKSSI